MTFGQAVRTCMWKYLSIRGRACRSEFWWFVVFIHLSQVVLFIAGSVLVLVAGSSTNGNRENAYSHWSLTSGSAGAGMTAYLLIAVIAIVTVPPWLVVHIRRLHDLGLSGFFILLHAIPGIGSIIIFVLMCLPGSTGTNRFGPDPLARYETTRW